MAELGQLLTPGVRPNRVASGEIFGKPLINRGTSSEFEDPGPSRRHLQDPQLKSIPKQRPKPQPAGLGRWDDSAPQLAFRLMRSMSSEDGGSSDRDSVVSDFRQTERREEEEEQVEEDVVPDELPRSSNSGGSSSS
ncbi:unnamed protein product, partial [Polarella glacialis]